MMFFNTRWRTTVAAHAMALAIAQPLGVHAEPDALQRPALVSERAVKSVMLGIARAGERLVAVGERGIVLLSDNDGRSWRQATTPVSVSLTNVTFAGARQGWAVGHGGIVLHTADGGESWAIQLDGYKVATLVLEAARWLGGSTLADAERLVAEGADKPLLDVHFFDAQHGLVVGAYGLALDTEDGGMTWTPLTGRVGDNRGLHLYSILEADKKVYLAGEQGALFVSDDGGRRFRPLRSPYTGSFFGLAKGRANELVAYGMRGNAYWSGDGGNSWQRSVVPMSKSLVANASLEQRLVLANDEGDLLESRDGGRSFTAMKNPKLPPLTGVVEGRDGGLIVTGVRGAVRVAMNEKGGAAQ